MNSQVDSAINNSLPQPANEMSQLPPIHAPQSFQAPEVAAPQFAGAATPIPAAPAALPVATAVSQAQIPDLANGSLPMDTPQEETDDAFDEEWVIKAKQIVEKNQTDPFLMSNELSKLKAQYIKARYNKDIKVSE